MIETKILIERKNKQFFLTLFSTNLKNVVFSCTKRIFFCFRKARSNEVVNTLALENLQISKNEICEMSQFFLTKESFPKISSVLKNSLSYDPFFLKFLLGLIICRIIEYSFSKIKKKSFNKLFKKFRRKFSFKFFLELFQKLRMWSPVFRSFEPVFYITLTHSQLLKLLVNLLIKLFVRLKKFFPRWKRFFSLNEFLKYLRNLLGRNKKFLQKLIKEEIEFEETSIFAIFFFFLTLLLALSVIPLYWIDFDIFRVSLEYLDFTDLFSYLKTGNPQDLKNFLSKFSSWKKDEWIEEFIRYYFYAKYLETNRYLPMGSLKILQKIFLSRGADLKFLSKEEVILKILNIKVPPVFRQTDNFPKYKIKHLRKLFKYGRKLNIPPVKVFVKRLEKLSLLQKEQVERQKIKNLTRFTQFFGYHVSLIFKKFFFKKKK